MLRTIFQGKVIEKHYELFSRLKLIQFLLSHEIFAFFYGIFLFGYEIWLTRNIISVIHPIFIIWGFLLIGYDVMIRRSWEIVFLQKLLFLFVIMAMITGIINYEVGITQNLKVWILTALPILTLYPICFLGKSQRIKGFIISFLGAAIVIFVSSLISVYMFLIRFGGTILFLGQELTVGIFNGFGKEEVAYTVLNGIYVDSGHAATYAMSSVIYSCILFFACRKEKLGKQIWNRMGIIFSVLNIIVQLCYFTLANSRGGWLSFFVTVFICVFIYIFFYGFRKIKRCKCLFALCIAIVAVGFSCVFLIHLRDTISYFSFVIEGQRVEKAQAEKSSIVEGKKECNPTENQKSMQEQEKITEEKEVPAKVQESVDDQKQEKVEVDSFERPEESGDRVGSGRIGIWKEAVSLYLKKPIFGEAPGNSTYYARKYDIGERLRHGKAIHNSYLDLLVDYGLIGFLLLMGFYVLCAWKVLMKLIRDGKSCDISFFMVIGGIIMTMSSSFFLSCSFVNTTALYFINLVFMSYLMSGNFFLNHRESKAKS